MPLYDLRCETCNQTERDVHHAIKAPHPACPKCGGSRSHVPSAFSPERYFHGDEQWSRRWYIHPDNVAAAQRDMPEVAQCITPQGVKFAGRMEERAFVRAMARSGNRYQSEVELDEQIIHGGTP